LTPPTIYSDYETTESCHRFEETLGSCRHLSEHEIFGETGKGFQCKLCNHSDIVDGRKHRLSKKHQRRLILMRLFKLWGETQTGPEKEQLAQIVSTLRTVTKGSNCEDHLLLCMDRRRWNDTIICLESQATRPDEAKIWLKNFLIKLRRLPHVFQPEVFSHPEVYFLVQQIHSTVDALMVRAVSGKDTIP
jgi:hypothetical protein